MPVRQYSIGIKTPARKKKNGGSFLLDLDMVESWINNLPRGNIGKTAQQLFHALQDINTITLDYEDRVDYLELVREPLYCTTSVLKKHFVSENFPLNKKQKKVAEISRQFCILMMTGYILAIEEMFEESGNKLDKDLLSLLIHRAVSYLSQLFLISYQTYTSVPEGIWSKLHKLYLFAEDNNIDKIKVSNDHYQYITRTTIVEEYVRVLLLALASPYHLRNNEIGKVYINIERWMGLIKINSPSSKGIDSKHFIVNLKSDMPVISADKKLKIKYLRVLDVSELIHGIDSELQRSEIISSHTLISVNLGDASLPHDLLRRLKRSWASIGNPIAEDNKINQKISLAVGISAIHRLIQDISVRCQHGIDIKKISNRNVKQFFENISHCDEDDIEVINIQSSILKTKSIAADYPGIKQQQSADDRDWLLINENKGEYCLQCSGSCIQQLQVGEVVGVRYMEGENPDRFALTIISWMKIYSNSVIKLGLKLISSSVVPIEIKMLAEGLDENRPQRALLLPVMRQVGLPSSIFVFPTPFRSGSTVSINIYGVEIPIRLTHKMGSSGLYCRYEYEKIEKQQKQRTKNKAADSDSSEFDDVWTSI